MDDCTSRAEQFNNLSKACLALDDFILNTSVTTIAVLMLQANYNYMTNDPMRGSKGWVILGIAGRLAQIVRSTSSDVFYYSFLSDRLTVSSSREVQRYTEILSHSRDPEIFGLPPEQVAERRKIAVCNPAHTRRDI